MDKLSPGYYRVVIRYGFMNRTDIRAVIRIIQNKYLKIDLEDTTIFVGRDTLIPSQSVGMNKWRNRLFLMLAKNSERAVKYFNLPADQVMEIGTHVKF